MMTKWEQTMRYAMDGAWAGNEANLQNFFGGILIQHMALQMHETVKQWLCDEGHSRSGEVNDIGDYHC